MPNLGAPELIIILVIVIVIFGVGKLPEIGGALGKGIKEFRESAGDPHTNPTADTTVDVQKTTTTTTTASTTKAAKEEL